MSAVAYIRISEQDQSNNSLDNQEVRIREYCINNNITLERVFTDNGKSAFTFDRPEWIALEKYLKVNKQIKFLLVYHIDRFSRANLMDALVKLNEIEVKLKVKVLSVTDPLNLDTKDFSVQLLRSINLLFSNNERNRIQERTKDGVYRSLANGRFCNMAPYGYKNSRGADKKPLLVIDPIAAKVVKKIFHLYMSGMDLFAIAKEVKQNDGFKQNHRSAIKTILTNPLYAALIRLPAYKGQPPQDVTAIHAPIVSRQEYYSIQNKLNQKKVSAQKNEDVWLRGVLHCECGRLMTAGNSKSRSGRYYWYYKCQEHQINFSAGKLHSKFMYLLDELSLPDPMVEEFKINILEAIDKHTGKRGGVIMRNKLELDKIKKKIALTQERYLTADNVDPQVYARVINELKVDETRLEGEIGKNKTDTDFLLTTLTELLPKMTDIKNTFIKWPLHQQQFFINTIFGSGLFYKDQIYRTAFLHPLFNGKELILKEKGLLEIEQSSNFLIKTEDGIGERTSIEHLQEIFKIFVA